MDKHLRISLRSYLVFLSVLIFSLFSVLKAQTTAKILNRFDDPSSIDPLNIQINDFNSEDFQPLKMVADVAYSQKNYLEAARIYLYIVNKNSDDCESYYKIACCYGNMDMATQAINFLIMAINAGYNNFEKIKTEKAFELLEKDPAVRAQLSEVEQYGFNFGRSAYFKVTKFEKCRLFFPDEYDPDKEYPLVIGLHGNGGNALEFSRLWSEIKDLNVIYAVPESPYNYSTNGGALTQQYTWGIPERDEKLWEIADTLITGYISDIASGMKSDYKISSTIILGFSQGAAYAYATGIRYNDNFDGLICFGGRIPSVEDYPWLLSSRELEENNDLKVFIAHGTSDMAINISEARNSFRTLKKYGYNTKFRSFESGHYVPGDILVEAIKWMVITD
ncbi:MAG TPA: hypothetical protein VMW76_09570 [Bacteroidales bacterium]|nr:hypothetical protein [Bacteroidales bacterium]